MGGPIDKGRKAIKKEQHDSSPRVAEFEGPQSHLVRFGHQCTLAVSVIIKFREIYRAVRSSLSAIAWTCAYALHRILRVAGSWRW